MPDTRQKNKDWRVTTEDGKYWEGIDGAIFLAVMLDLRDELRSMNSKLSVLQCSNFLKIPQTLKDIRKNTTKRKRVTK